ncbi:MAG: glycosyltransferase family 39 protein [Deltaproteobacteria bacterium]|nr:glycosyltransferase family 39 protein [Deltaproteobacteria bacterium]
MNGIKTAALLALILALAGIFRFTGLNWDEGTHLHPDERFLTMVAAAIEPAASFAEYFNTGASRLNPANAGHSFYVYGTLPLIIVRYLAEATGFTGYDRIHLLGRFLSGLCNLASVLLIFCTGRRLYGTAAGLWAALFAACNVLFIQLSHFFIVDTFALLFSLPLLYLSVGISLPGAAAAGREHDCFPVRECLLFSFFLGLCLASKLSFGLAGLLLPAAMAVRSAGAPRGSRLRQLVRMLPWLGPGALIACVVFRVCQPYAFLGPGFFSWSLSPDWLKSIKELSSLTSGLVDFPPSLQWARRPPWFSLANLTVWGMGAVQALVAAAALIALCWHVAKGSWRRHAIILGWTLGNFFIMASLWNTTMRYQLLTYPGCIIAAAWAACGLQAHCRASSERQKSPRFAQGAMAFLQGWSCGRLRRYACAALVIFLGVTAVARAAAFVRIYMRQHTRVAASLWMHEHIASAVNMRILAPSGAVTQPLTAANTVRISHGEPFLIDFAVKQAGVLEGIAIPHAADMTGLPADKTLYAALVSRAHTDQILATAAASVQRGTDGSGQAHALYMRFDGPVSASPGEQYMLILILRDAAEGDMVLEGSRIACESSWDDALPVRPQGYEGYVRTFGDFLNLELYHDDGPEKLSRMLSVLDRADVLCISSSRQWGSIPRLPERYPLTTAFYRLLLGCPPEKTVEQWCRSASLSMVRGSLGYDCVAVFESFPGIGGLAVNDQAAEEAFTVYDHPKVFIFQKSPAYSSAKCRAALAAVDLSRMQKLPLASVPLKPTDIMLPAERFAAMKSAAAGQSIFAGSKMLKSSGAACSLVWYLFIFALGAAAYPLVIRCFPGLHDKGYPLARIAGLLAFAWIAWLAGSCGIAMDRPALLFAVLLIVACGLFFGRKNFQALRLPRGYLAGVEALALAAFLFSLALRIFNPDLWHPFRGGEKPMDFGYFNAVLQSPYFPPYDPWYAGGIMNYYYYGFLMFGLPAKLMGIAPQVAYNLIVPTIFSFLVLAAFSLGWNLRAEDAPPEPSNVPPAPSAFRWALQSPWAAGMGAAAALALAGNLGVIPLLANGLQSLLSGGEFLISPGEWYWAASRIIPGQGDVPPITEFPFFTVLHADLHAHLFVLPVFALSLAWALSVALRASGKARAQAPLTGWHFASVLLAGALIAGSMRVINAWNFPAACGLSGLALCWYVWRQRRSASGGICHFAGSAARTLVCLAAFVLLCYGLYYPFSCWYAQGYGAFTLWKGPRTPISAFLVHWGLFLYIFVSSYAVEAARSIRSSSRPARWLLAAVLLVVTSAAAGCVLNLQPAALILPLAALSMPLLAGRERPLSQRIEALLFLIGGLLCLTVECAALSGDVGRMNTVFKTYLQVWVFWGLAATLALIRLMPQIKALDRPWRQLWIAMLALLLSATALYPVLAIPDKLADRFSGMPAASLDGMAYMRHARHVEQGRAIELSDDYGAILWMQEHARGLPVIVEAHTPEYHWGGRFSIYTGLPAVIGWSWHQRQQRNTVPSHWVYGRIEEVRQFYTTTDEAAAAAFLRRYGISFIIVGELERIYYPGPGLDKFAAPGARHWKAACCNGATIVYEVGDLSDG